MYHYTDCGLKNVWLVNGYSEIETPYGKAVSVDDVDGLDRAIARSLVLYKPKFTGLEVRFLRKHLGMSQHRFGQLFDKDAQSIAIWEKRGTIPKLAANTLRMIVIEFHGENSRLTEIIDKFNEIDRDAYEQSLKFEESNNSWKIAA